MFSYTDDAIVTSSPTGRHLSTVIRRPAAIDPLDWNEHAEQVCKVLNELDRNAKLNYRVCYSLGAGFQTAGRVKRVCPDNYDASAHATTAQQFAQRADGPSIAELIDGGYLAPQPRQPMPSSDPQREENLALRRKLDDATTKLCAAQMLLEKPVRLTVDDVLRILNLETDTAIEVDGRTLARVE